LYENQKQDVGSLAADADERVSGRRVLVLGLGNLLLRDEGIGVHVAAELQKMELPANAEVVDGGTAGMDILLSQEGSYKLVVIDAMTGGKQPGTIYRTHFGARQIDRLKDLFSQMDEFRISLHQVGLIEALTVARKMGCAPNEVVIIGVEPMEMDTGLEPTGPIKQRIPEIINTVLEEIKNAVHSK
jgi:hydrogenase maturation protease